MKKLPLLAISLTIGISFLYPFSRLVAEDYHCPENDIHWAWGTDAENRLILRGTLANKNNWDKEELIIRGLHQHFPLPPSIAIFMAPGAGDAAIMRCSYGFVDGQNLFRDTISQIVPYRLNQCNPPNQQTKSVTCQ